MATNPTLTGQHIPEGQEVQVPGDDIDLNAYQARPQGLETTAGVIVIHENQGLAPYLREVADGLASAGYTAVAPDLLSQEGGTQSLLASGKEIPPILSEIPRDRFVRDVGNVARYLRGQLGVSRLGIIGFCFGGGITWRYATVDQDLAAAIPFYGANPPLEAVPNIRAAVLAVYGEQDERINQGISAITEALEQARVTHQTKIYPQAAHAFHNHTNAGRYQPDAARDAWADALAWLDKYLRDT